MNHKKRVLILCTGNSARSQMGEGAAAARRRGGRFEVESAGTQPSSVRARSDRRHARTGHRYFRTTVEIRHGVRRAAFRLRDHGMRQRTRILPGISCGPATMLHHSFDASGGVQRLAGRTAGTCSGAVRDELRNYLDDFARGSQRLTGQWGRRSPFVVCLKTKRRSAFPCSRRTFLARLQPYSADSEGSRSGYDPGI